MSKRCYQYSLEKSYLDIIEGYNEKTETWKKDVHTRMKGVPTKCVSWRAGGTEAGVVQLYEHLLSSKSIEFDMTQDGGAANMIRQANFTVSNRDTCPRTVWFPGSDMVCYTQTVDAYSSDSDDEK